MATVDKRVRKKASGAVEVTWRVRYLDDKGKRRERNFDKRGLAVDFSETLSTVRSKADPPVSEITFKDMTERYLDACARGREGKPALEETSVNDYRWRIEKRLLPLLGDVPLSQIKRKDVTEARDRLLGAGARSSARKCLFLLKAVLGHAVEEEVLSKNPATDVSVHKDHRRAPEVAQSLPIHTQEEMTLILQAAKEQVQGTYTAHAWKRLDLMLNTMVFAGLRMSELRGLPVHALDGNTLRVSQRADMLGNIGSPKSASGYRTIHIPRELAEKLHCWMDGREGLAFATRTGKPIAHNNLSKNMWHRAQEIAGVRKLNPHSARHFFASMLIDQGAPLKMLQEQMGHSDPMFTLRVYGHLFKSEADLQLRAEMAEKMGKSLAFIEEED